ncbi:MAG: LacI family DNA-binding transcriptional regulator [Actinomycetaceae bacterium]|nr:LacI family DNA-binding transcriptional regulator [Actinomycetaceae bacterium]
MLRGAGDNGRRATLADVAARAKVSLSTVSNVLNHPEIVGEEKRTAVRKAMKELHYIPNLLARGLKTGKAQVIGIVFYDLANPFFANMAQQVSREAKEHGYTTIVMSTDQIFPLEKAHIEELVQHGIEGLILTSAGMKYDHLLVLAALGIPTVLVAQQSQEFRVGSISVDDKRAMSKITQHILAQQAKKLLFIDGPGTIPQHIERYAGVRHAVECFAPDGQIQLERTIADAPDAKGGYSAVKRKLKKDEVFDAYICINDFTAFGAITCLREYDFDIPQDVIVTGFDDSVVADLINLTTVAQPIEKMSRWAVKTIVSSIQQGSSEMMLHELIEPELKIRASSSR